MKKILLSIMGIVILLAGFLYYFSTPLFYTYLNSVEVTELTIDGKTLTMNNLINSKTPEQFKKVFKENPDIDTMIIGTVEGSIDDEANLELAKWLYQKKLTFILLSDSEIASGGTDLFLAGNDRVIYKGAKIGVHSWAGGTKVATDYPVGDAAHQPYIDYYMDIGWDKKKAEEFYYFTINSATADNIHWMSDEEFTKYGIATEEIK